ncbi:ubiquitin-related modifier 1 [Pyronema domesticum]|uniref:Ubiquitin-related modifier 1 n=1 Tax=Pyronema omphalodes (strain CBS 100304) TaxID=1076935 RepID=U4KYB0_PYROM|nr:ubiquitin-related modifier 1 [Pyronema domesticum]CCX07207.1 Similar to Ubiquitin-related modifier 1; acc. no. B2WIC3 [Pyronema omphalodes CBS 100304]
MANIPITVEFSGGLELLFASERSLSLEVAEGTTVGELVNILVDKHMVDTRTELFVVDGTVRPGILVLINDADWELEGEESYVLEKKDTILFVSTLHGG